MMADSSADTLFNSRCPFCLEDLTNMMQPKQLTCGHLYCLKCLQGHFGAQQELSCSFCGWVVQTSCPVVSNNYLSSISQLYDVWVQNQGQMLCQDLSCVASSLFKDIKGTIEQPNIEKTVSKVSLLNLNSFAWYFPLKYLLKLYQTTNYKKYEKLMSSIELSIQVISKNWNRIYWCSKPYQIPGPITSISNQH